MSISPLLAAIVILLVLCDIATRKALWGYLIPGFARTGYRGVRRRITGTAGALRRRWAQARAVRKRAAAPAARPSALKEKLAAAAPEEEVDKESVFEKAKRRSRG